MTRVCLDVEWVEMLENWIGFAGKVGVLEFKRARCDEPDFDGVVEISSN